MPHYVKIPFSNSTDGAGILVTEGSSTTSGTLIHTAVSGGGHDEIYMWVTRSPTVSIASAILNIMYGGVACGDIVTIAGTPTIDTSAFRYLVVPGLPLACGVEIRAHLGTLSGNGHAVHGYVNRWVT